MKPEAETIKTGRRDHYLPQGYMRGFIDPARENLDRPLWRLDISYSKWYERSPKEFGYKTGFYDYAGTGPELETVEQADEAFKEYENEFPRVREKLLSRGFRNWKKQLGFLLRYMQMIRARSPLFFAQKEAEGKTLQALIVQEVHPDGKTLTVSDPVPLTASQIKNRAITQMREEIRKGADWLWEFNWAIRYCESVNAPFVTSEAPFFVETTVPANNIVEALAHPDSLIFFPICWQGCLFGSRKRFDTGTDKFGLEDMRTLRRKYRSHAKVFLLSPTKLDDITEWETAGQHATAS